MYYLTHTRLDIENAVGIVGGFQDDPKDYHFIVMKTIFRYLKGTSNYGIRYDRLGDFTLCAHTNVYCIGNMNDRKSTNDGALFLGVRLVSWLSKKQDCILKSTIEVAYVVAKNNYNQVMSMK